MFVFVAYTLPPLRLNYRGGGELLEMLGVGLALPLYNVYLQAGAMADQRQPLSLTGLGPQLVSRKQPMMMIVASVARIDFPFN